MRAYRHIGGHSWSQPITELLHKQGSGMPPTLIAEESRIWGKWRGMWRERIEQQRNIHMSCSFVSYLGERAGGNWNQNKGKDQMAILFWVQQRRHYVTSFLCRPQSCFPPPPLHVWSLFPILFVLSFLPHSTAISSHVIVPANPYNSVLLSGFLVTSGVRRPWCNTEAHSFWLALNMHVRESCGKHSAAALMSTLEKKKEKKKCPLSTTVI